MKFKKRYVKMILQRVTKCVNPVELDCTFFLCLERLGRKWNN